MSGYKRATISITRDEYDRLRDAEHHLRQVPEMPYPAVQFIQQQSNESIRSSIREIEQRQASYQQLLGGLDEGLRRYERKTSQALVEVQKRSFERAQELAGSLWDHVNSLLVEQQHFLAAALEEHQRRNQVEFSRLDQTMQQMEQAEQEKQALAAAWIAYVDRLAAFIQDQYACDFFKPGAIGALLQQIDLMRGNFTGGMYEAAVLGAQQTFAGLSDLRLELEQAHHAWQIMLCANWETASQILSYAVESEYVQAVDLGGEPLPYQINVDYWSRGRLARLMEKINGFLDRLAEESPSFDLAALERWKQDDLPRFYQELEETILDARIHALNSQLRINIADLVVQALHEQGFSLEGSSYESADERLAYQARLVNLKGSEVLVQVTPSGPALGENELEIESLDQSVRTEYQLRQRWNEVNRALSMQGLTVGPYVEGERPTAPQDRRKQPAVRANGRAATRAGRPEMQHGD